MTSNFVEIDSELVIHYEESGRGDTTILMLPGWTMSTRVYERQLEYFAASKTHRFITFDPRAHGLSSKTEGGHFYQQHGIDLHHFIMALKLKNIVLCGWSFGTLATLSYVHQYGSKDLSGFIMLDGPPKATGEDNKQDWVTYEYADGDRSQEFYTMGRLVNKDSTNRQFVDWMLEHKTDENIEKFIEITNQTPDTAAALLNASANFIDHRKELIQLSREMPVLYIVREDQNEIVTRWSAANTPAAKVVAFGEHLMFWERATEFNAVLEDYLAQCKVPD